MERRVVIGCDIGKKQDPSCVVVTEQVGESSSAVTSAGCRWASITARWRGASAPRITAPWPVVATANAKAATSAFGDLTGDPHGPAARDRGRGRCGCWSIRRGRRAGRRRHQGARRHPRRPPDGRADHGWHGHNFRLGDENGTVSKQFLVSQLKRLTGFDPPLLSCRNQGGQGSGRGARRVRDQHHRHGTPAVGRCPGRAR